MTVETATPTLRVELTAREVLDATVAFKWMKDHTRPDPGDDMPERFAALELKFIQAFADSDLEIAAPR